MRQGSDNGPKHPKQANEVNINIYKIGMRLQLIT